MNVLQLWEDIRDESGLNNTPTNQAAFIRAVNSVVRDINNKLKPSTDISEITEVTNVDLGVSSWHENAVLAGLRFYMQRARVWAQDPDPESRGFYKIAMGEAMSGEIDNDDDMRTRTMSSGD